MKRIRCYTGQFRGDLSVPADLSLRGKSVEAYISEASLSGGSRQIVMKLDRRREELATTDDANPANTYYLQQALMALVPAQPTDGSVRIGVVYADTFSARPGVLGFMFDEGFTPRYRGSRNDRARRVPREGCAVFLDAIRALREPEGRDAVQSETVFTTLHELGHVFNLWHIRSPLSFMAPSSSIRAYRSSDHAFRFLNENDGDYLSHREMLQACATAAHVCPGQSPFGVRGGLGPEGGGAENEIPRRGPAGPLQFDISVSQDDVWPFEPVELEVRLSLRRSAVRAVSFPDVIDPGYPHFQILIEEPSGERFLYRPGNNYCHAGAKRSLRPGESFERDISIFGQSGGYTFRMPGEHRIEVKLRLGGNKVLKASTALEVRAPRPRFREYERTRELLEDRRIANLLFYRAGRVTRRELDELNPAIRHLRRSHAGPALEYAIGRALHDQALRKPTRLRIERSGEFLERAIGNERLSAHRRRIAERLLA